MHFWQTRSSCDLLLGPETDAGPRRSSDDYERHRDRDYLGRIIPSRKTFRHHRLATSSVNHDVKPRPNIPEFATPNQSYHDRDHTKQLGCHYQQRFDSDFGLAASGPFINAGVPKWSGMIGLNGDWSPSASRPCAM